jgi:hypothetical protein
MDNNGQSAVSSLNELDDLARSILALEIKNPGISSIGIVKELGRHIDRKTIDNRRRTHAYQVALLEMRRDNILEVKAAQSRAIQRLTELLEHPDPPVSLAAARILAEPSLRGATKKAEAQVEDERVSKPVENSVRVIFGDENSLAPIIGETMMDDSGKVVPITRIQNPLQIESTPEKAESQSAEPDESLGGLARYIVEGMPLD